MGSINHYAFCTVHSHSKQCAVNKSRQHWLFLQGKTSRKDFGNAENRTQGRCVRSKNAIHCDIQPPSHQTFFNSVTFFFDSTDFVVSNRLHHHESRKSFTSNIFFLISRLSWISDHFHQKKFFSPKGQKLSLEIKTVSWHFERSWNEPCYNRWATGWLLCLSWAFSLRKLYLSVP